jgi:hypothetical protein
MKENNEWKQVLIIGLAVFVGVFMAGAAIKLWIEHDVRVAMEEAAEALRIETARIEKEQQERMMEFKARQSLAAEKAKRLAAEKAKQLQAQIAIRNEAIRKKNEIQNSLNSTCSFWTNEYNKNRNQSNYAMYKTACNRASTGHPY